MTVEDLKKILENLPDDMQVCYEYDGPDANTEVDAGACIIFEDRILLVEKVVVGQ